MSEDAPAPEPWDPQPGETARAFQAWQRYCGLLPRARSVVAAYRQETGREHARHAPGTWNGWASRYDWPARALAVDRHKALETAEQVVQERREAARNRITIGRFAMRKALESLQSIGQLSASEAARLLDVGHRLERESFPEVQPVVPAVHQGEDVLEELRETLVAAIRAGDLRAGELLLKLDERLAKRDGTDAPAQLEVGMEGTLNRLFAGQALANLSPALRRQVLAELEPGEMVEAGEGP